MNRASRVLACIATAGLLVVLTSTAQAHGPSGGGPDDPEASARLLRFDSGLNALRPLDERPVRWVVPVVSQDPPATTSNDDSANRRQSRAAAADHSR